VHLRSPLDVLRPGDGRLTLLPRGAVALAPRRHSPGEPVSGHGAEEQRAEARRALAEGRYERAAVQLAVVVAGSPQEAASWSDLAALHLRRAAIEHDGFAAFQALAAADHALTAEPMLRPARFNHALALERLALAEEARAEWCALQRTESDAGWLRDEQAHCQSLAAVPDSRDWKIVLNRAADAAARRDGEALRRNVVLLPQRFREHVEDEVLVDWAAAVRRGDSAGAARMLDLARSLADALRMVNGEHLPADAIAAIDRWATSAARCNRAAAAFVAYGHALRLMRLTDFAAAVRELGLVHTELLAQGNPMALRAACQLAYCRYQRSEYREEERLLREVVAQAQPSLYPAVHGRAHWLLGLIASIGGRLTESLADQTLAAADFERLHEATNLARVESLIAEDWVLLGKESEAWRVLVPALHSAPRVEPLVQRAALYQMAAFVALEAGEPGAAASFQTEALRLARASGDPDTVATVLRSRAVTAALLGRRSQALGDLEEAVRWLATIRDPQNRRVVSGDINLVQGEILRNLAPPQAVAALDRAVKAFRATSYHYLLQRALFERALCQASLGRRDAEEHDLRASISELERQREAILPVEERVTYLVRTRALFAAMVSLQLERRHKVAAFTFAEAVHARVLLDWILLRTGLPPSAPIVHGERSLAALRHALPWDTALIEYFMFADRLIAFIVEHRGLQVVTIPVGKASIDEEASRLVAAVRAGRVEAVDASLTTLHDLLIRPLLTHLRPSSENLVFVPDGSLNAIPFAALRERATGRRLVQDHGSVVAPSATIFAANSQRDRALASRPGTRALVVADPAFDRGLYPQLSRLPGAAAEQAIATSFPSFLTLRGAKALKTRFLALAPAYQIIHFAGHSIVDLENPLHSLLLFAADAKDPEHGALTTADLLAERLPTTRLVVLASCASGSGRLSDTEGVESLARPFLAAGAPTVVASLWTVDDDLTARFMASFYGYLHGNGAAAEALRRAQLDFLGDSDELTRSPLAWAAFETIGASGASPSAPPLAENFLSGVRPRGKTGLARSRWPVSTAGHSARR
jgi:CHAT domain-containing protein